MKWDLAKIVDQVRSVCEIDPSGCWLWRHESWAHRDYSAKREYPRLMIAGRRQHVSRWVTEAVAGLAPGMEPCHSCDRPECVNPEHLHWGTHQENMAEMGQRQRSGASRHPEKYRDRKIDPATVPRGDDHWMRKNPDAAAILARRVHGSKTHPERWARGERQGSAKLTEEKVRIIRRYLAAGESALGISRVMGVERGTIRAIAEGRTWKHVA